MNTTIPNIIIAPTPAIRFKSITLPAKLYSPAYFRFFISSIFLLLRYITNRHTHPIPENIVSKITTASMRTSISIFQQNRYLCVGPTTSCRCSVAVIRHRTVTPTCGLLARRLFKYARFRINRLANFPNALVIAIESKSPAKT